MGLPQFLISNVLVKQAFIISRASYLYGYCFWRRHCRHPFGEAAHGPEDILDHYLTVLPFDDPFAAAAASGHSTVEALRAPHDHHTPEALRGDLRAIFGACIERFQRRQVSFLRQSSSHHLAPVPNRRRGSNFGARDAREKSRRNVVLTKRDCRLISSSRDW